MQASAQRTTEQPRSALPASRSNPLIRCIREKETALKRKAEKLDTGALTPLAWFSVHLDLPSAYEVLKHEFHCISELWYNSKNHKTAPFIMEPSGNNEERKLSVNAQEVLSPYAGVGLFASEGPTKTSVFDFWSLVYQRKIECVMSVNYPLQERLHQQTHNEETETIQYWPFESGQEMFFMPYKISCVASECKCAPSKPSVSPSATVYRISHLRVTYCNPLLGVQPEHKVTHLCYYRWPDARLPVPLEGSNTSMAAVEMVSIVEQDLSWPNRSLLIHCHAGIGRTGTLMAILMSMQQLEKEGAIDIKGIVDELRESRPRAVMNYWQYIFIFLTIAQTLMSRGLLAHSFEVRLARLWNELLSDIPRQFDG